MILYRALNEYDLICDPLVNGIASKKMMYDLTLKYLVKKKNFNSESLIGKERFVYESMNDYLKKYYYELEKKFLKKYHKSRRVFNTYFDFMDLIYGLSDEAIMDLVDSDYYDFGNYIKFFNLVSTLPSHLISGSKIYTDWVSTSKDLDVIIKEFYNKSDQINNMIAVIDMDTNGFYSPDYNLCVDLSSGKKNEFICNKIKLNDEQIKEYVKLCRKNPNCIVDFDKEYIVSSDYSSRVYGYPFKFKEVCIFRYIPKESVVNVLDALQVDIYKKGRLNPDNIINLCGDSVYELKRLKNKIYDLLRDDSTMLYFFNELYLENKNINCLVNEDTKMDYVEHYRDKILNLALNVPSGVIKKY